MSDTHISNGRGVWEVNRRIRIPSLVHEADAAAVNRALTSQNGVKHVSPDTKHHRVSVRYDATEMDYRTVLRLLEEQGFPPTNNWWARLKANWFQFTDSNARENANLPPPACCSKAPRKR